MPDKPKRAARPSRGHRPRPMARTGWRRCNPAVGGIYLAELRELAERARAHRAQHDHDKNKK